MGAWRVHALQFLEGWSVRGASPGRKSEAREAALGSRSNSTTQGSEGHHIPHTLTHSLKSVLEWEQHSDVGESPGPARTGLLGTVMHAGLEHVGLPSGTPATRRLECQSGGL